MTSQTSASKILSAIAKNEWKKMGQNSETPPATPDGIRQWILDITESEEDLNYARLRADFKTGRQTPKEPEPDNGSMKMWHRVTRCWQQHAIDVPAQGYNIEITLDSSGLEKHRVEKPLCIPTELLDDDRDKIECSVIHNALDIEPRTIVSLAAFAIWNGWNNEKNLKPLKDLHGISSLEDGIVALHKLWAAVDKKHKKAFYHPIAAMVQAYLQETTAIHCSAEHDRKYPVAVLKHPIGNVRELAFTENDVGQVFQTPARVEQIQQMELELGCDASLLPSIMPLQVVRTAGLKAQTKSGAVSHELRIFFEAMMALQPNQHRADLMFRIGDLIDFLYPNGKFHWTNQMPHIARALGVLHTYATVPWIDDQGSIREWRPVAVRAPLIDEATRETPIYIEVQMPPDAKRGHMVIKDIHRKVGMKSAAQWNAYHVAAYLWDKHGTVKGKLVDPTRPIETRDEHNRLVDATGKPLLTRNGKAIQSPYHPEAVRQLEREPNTDAIQRYPVLSTEDLIQACYPNGYPKNNRRKYLQRAKAHWQQLEDDGYIVIHKELNGWRILPSAKHLNAHRALRKASKGVY